MCVFVWYNYPMISICIDIHEMKNKSKVFNIKLQNSELSSTV